MWPFKRTNQARLEEQMERTDETQEWARRQQVRAERLEDQREEIIQRQLRLVAHWEQLAERVERMVSAWEKRGGQETSTGISPGPR